MLRWPHSYGIPGENGGAEGNGRGRRRVAPNMQRRTPRIAEEIEDEFGTVTRYRRHPNGRGLVATDASVDPTAFLAPSVYVESGARVGRSARIHAGTWVDREAVVGPHAEIGASVHVGAAAVVGEGAHIGSHSKIGARAHIGAGARIAQDQQVGDDAVLPGQSEFGAAA
jgi:UDP-3-O-[3-hydroxymyristoyl] glucosamine N-acyltransferase